MASYYWSLTGPDVGVNDSSSQPVHPWPPPLSLRLKAAPNLPQEWAHRKSGHPSLWRFGAQAQGSALWWGLGRAG